MTPQQLQHIAEQVNVTATNGAPIAADERLDRDHFWPEDPCDNVLPSTRGFVTDCRYYMRGRECPGLFIEWSSLYAIASVVKREAWLKWGDGQLYTNLYLLICGPAGAVKKNTAIDFAAKLMKHLDREIEDENIKRMKCIDPFTASATMEALVGVLQPENQRGTPFDFVHPDGSLMLDDDGQPIHYNLSSELSICQHEFCNFVGKSSYMEGLVPFLIDMFDAPDDYSRHTIARKNELLEDVLINMIAASAPAAVKESLPAPAIADGFLSRMLIVYQSSTTSEYDEPIIPKPAPTMGELRKRLAWIASNTFGEWNFTDEARAWKKQWYHHWKQQSLLDGLFMGIKSRLDVITYRVALLFRWQRYERDDMMIHVQDLKDADALIQRTFRESIPMYRMLIDRGASNKSLQSEEYIKRVKRTTRELLIRNAHVPAEDAYYAVQRLKSEGLIKISLNGNEMDESTRNPKEIYTWVEEVEDKRLINDKPAASVFVKRQPQRVRTKTKGDE